MEIVTHNRLSVNEWANLWHSMLWRLFGGMTDNVVKGLRDQKWIIAFPQSLTTQ